MDRVSWGPASDEAGDDAAGSLEAVETESVEGGSVSSILIDEAEYGPAPA
jgi:hypothetical protein